MYSLGRGYTGARTDTTEQTNICLGIHRQTRVVTFNPTCLSRLIATAAVLPQNQFLYNKTNQMHQFYKFILS